MEYKLDTVTARLPPHVNAEMKKLFAPFHVIGADVPLEVALT